MGEGKHIERKWKGAGIPVPILPLGGSKRVSASDWPKDLLVSWLFQTLHSIANVIQPAFPEIWDDGPTSEGIASLRGSATEQPRKTVSRSRKRQGDGYAVYRSP